MMINLNRQNNVSLNSGGDFLTIQNARKDLIGEIEAVIQYDNHIHETNDQQTINTLKRIKQDELMHIGELLALLNYLDATQTIFVQKGVEEFESAQNN